MIPSKSKGFDTLLIGTEGHALAGHSKDCAKQDDSIIIATDKKLQFFATDDKAFYTLHNGPTRSVVVASGWLAWLDDSHLYARRISTHAAVLK